MDRRTFMRAAGASAVAAAQALRRSAHADAPGRPNIILCMADDQGFGDMGYYGHPALRTPNFDAMAASGLRLDRFYAAAPVCSPTRGSVLTGRHPNRFGCFTWGYPLRPQERTLAHALSEAGYVTGHFGKWHLGSVRRGSPANPGAAGFDEWLSAENFFDIDPILSREGTAVPCAGESSMVTVDAALEFIARHASGPAPFLAVVWFGSPHRPHIAADEDRQHYLDLPDELQHYYGEVTGMDRAFGRLRDALGDLGVREDTLLWYCSDNGGLPEVGHTGGRGHKSQVYEGGLRIPGIIEWPAVIRQPGVSAIPCGTVDIHATALEAAGLTPDPGRPYDGISLMPLLRGETEARPSPMGLWHYPAPGIATPNHEWMTEVLEAQQRGEEPDDPARLRLDAGEIGLARPLDQRPGHAAWLDWPWKLHRIEDDEGGVRLELYDLAKDPDESADRLGEQSERAAAMRAELEDWQISVLRSLNGEDYAQATPTLASRHLTPRT